MEKYNCRADVPDKYKWDLTDFYQSDEDFNQDLAKVIKEVDDLKNYHGCTKDAKRLVAFLNKMYQTLSNVFNLYGYAYLINDQELGVSSSIARKSTTDKLLADYCTNTSFLEPEIIKLSKKEYDQLINNKDLAEYKVFLTNIYRQKKHILSKKEEAIINELTSNINEYEDMSSTMLNQLHNYGTVLIDGKEETITSTNLRRLIRNADAKTRKVIFEQFYSVINNYSVSSAQFLNGFVKSNIALCKIRKYKSAFDATLFSLNMPKKAFDMLVDTTKKHYGSYQNFLRIFKKVQKLDELNPYDLYLDFAKSEKEYTIEEAQQLCLEAIKPLGTNYYQRFKKIFDNHYIDYAQYKGKCAGGYSLSTYDHDSRILMSFNGYLSSVSTIIHEGGHNVNHQMINASNPVQYRETTPYVGEIASLTNECLLSSYLANNGKTKEEKLSGIANIIEVINNNLFDTIVEAGMEVDFYNYVENGGTITKDYMANLTNKAYEELEGNLIKRNELSSLTWTRRSHYFWLFYLYSYAFCIIGASYVANEILNGNKDIIDKYLEFLTLGDNVWPMDAFKVLGIDLTKKDVYEKAIKYYDDLLNKFEKVYNS